jgi:hypothetical protein
MKLSEAMPIISAISKTHSLDIKKANDFKKAVALMPQYLPNLFN